MSIILKIKSVFVFLFCLYFFTAKGQNKDVFFSDTTKTKGEKIITNAQQIGVGVNHILDTYLSNEEYRGLELRFISQTMREREHSLWTTMVMHQAAVSYTHNTVRNGNEWYGICNFQWGLYRKTAFFGNKLTLRYGDLIDTSIGVIYNMRNSNNPAQALVDFNISPSVILNYKFKIANRLPFALTYYASAPLIGIMFSPNYGQSYYEIFSQGNYDHNAVFTTPFNKPSLRHILSLDFMLAKAQFRLSYIGNYLQWNVNNIKSHSYSSVFTIGVVKHFKFLKIKQ